MTRPKGCGLFTKSKSFKGVFEELEQRILFSADAAAVLPYGPGDLQSVTQVVQATVQTATQSQVATTLVFLDSLVPERSVLLADLQKQQAAGRQMEIVVIDADQNGLDVITQTLAQHTNVGAIHILSHGDNQGLALGNTRLDASTLAQHASEVASWGKALTADADLMLYGCDLAASAQGLRLVDDLSLLTGSDVAASSDKTGAQLLGGNWDLEYQVGTIETPVVVDAQGQAQWQHLLNISASSTEAQVNNTTSGTQQNSTTSGKQIAADASGNHVVVWEDATTLDVYGRCYNADGTAATAEFKVNTYTTGTQNMPTVAMDSAGNFVVAWQSVGQDASAGGIYAQRYNAAGVAQGAEFQVNTYTSSDQFYPAIAMSTNGFVITWTSYLQDGSSYGIYAQRYNASGVAQGAEFRVNTTTNDIQKESQIGMDASGNFVIAWSSYTQDGSNYGVYAQRYNAAGTAQGSEFMVNITTANEQSLGDVSMNATGSFVVTWMDTIADGNGDGVYARTYNSSGTALTGEIQLAGFTYSTQIYPTVAMGDDGSFVAAWQTYTADGYSYGIVTRQFSLTGSELTPETIVNTTLTGDQLYPSVAWGGSQIIVSWNGSGDSDTTGVYTRRYAVTASNLLLESGTEQRANTTTSNTQQTSDLSGKQIASASNGNFVLVWEDTITDHSYARLYSADGTPITAEFRVNTDVTGARNKDQPTVAMDDSGNFVVAWRSQLQDGSGYGIYAQRYNASGVAQGAEFRVNTTTSNDQASPAIAMCSTGFVITWTSTSQDGSSEGIYAQCYNASGVAQGGEFLVNVTTSNIQKNSQIGMDSSGNFVIAWSSYAQDSAGYGVYARRYNASGVAQSSEFLVNTTTANEEIATDLSMNASGSFVIAWYDTVADGDSYGVFARTYNSSGTALSGEIQLNTYELSLQWHAAVDMTDNGNFVAAYQSNLQDGSGYAIALREFNSAGVEVAPERIVNTTQSGDQQFPSITWNGTQVVVSWSGNGTGDSNGVFFQRYTTNSAPVMSTPATVNVAENSTAVTTVTATDADSQTLTYSISGGFDAARFTINASTGALTFSAAPNYESPLDAGADNVYDVIVQVSDGSATDTQAIAVTVTAVNDNTPVITSLGGASTASISIAENSTAITTITATDNDLPAQTLTYSITGGADAALFLINGASGALTFVSGRNRENATDANSDHIYEVIVQASDGTYTDTQAISVTITDVDEIDVGAVSDANAAANSVAENAANGTLVGITANATDADATTNTITYSLSNSAGGRFAINASTGVVTVADGTLLNYESATSHSITVLATSADGSTSSQAFTVNLTDVNEFAVGAVTDVNGAANSVAENAANGTLVGIAASATDADGTNSAITYSLSDSAGGRFAINASTGVVTVANGSLLNFEATTSHTITVLSTSSDGTSSTQTFTINLSDVDEFDVGAVSDTNATINSVTENASAGTVVGITANASDADASTNSITYSLSDSAGGRFAIDATTGVVTVADGTLLNYESATSHSITALATSADGSTSSQAFTIILTDVNEFAVGAVTDANAVPNAVAESAANGTAVGITASASDADGGNNTITYSLSDSAGGRFAIDGTTGAVTVADGTLLDYESATSHSITVLATSADGSTNSQAFTINLTDVNEFAVGAVTDVNGAANTVAENAANGTLVGITASATDADGTNSAITYSLSDSAGGRFAINASTGVVTVADGSLLDYETASSHTITVQATSSDGSTNSQSFTVNLVDVGELSIGATNDTNGSLNVVAENAANGTTVGLTALAVDPDVIDTVSYALADDAGGRFAINASTGVVTVANGSLLNFEATTSHTITVLSTSSDGTSSTQTFTINLSDVNEFGVGAVTDVNAAANSVAENAANGTVVGITAGATDADGTNSAITYILSDSAGGRFSIDATTGIITVANGTLLDYESARSHTVTVMAVSSDGSAASQAFTIQLAPVNDNAPILSLSGGENPANVQMLEATTQVITVVATDADSPSSTLTFAIAGGLDASLFTLDPTTGALSFKAPPSHALAMDSNQDNVYEVVVEVSDGVFVTQLPLQILITTAPSRPEPAPEPVTSITTPTPQLVQPTIEAPVEVRKDEPVVMQPDTSSEAPEVEEAPAPAAGNKMPAHSPDRTAGAQEAQNGSQVRLTAGIRKTSAELDRQSDRQTAEQWLTMQELDAFPQDQAANLQFTIIAPAAMPSQTLLGIPSSRLDAPGRPAAVFASESQDENVVVLTSVSTAIKTGGLTLSVGMIWWATRAGSLLTSLIITTPAWRTLDPLPILVSDDDDDNDDAKTGAQNDADAQAEQMFGTAVANGEDVALIG